MQTFVPYGQDFSKTASSLDYRRLGKQRVEAWQILTTLQGKSKGWANHPAVKMWAGYESSLCIYGMIMCYEWRDRGYKDNMLPRFRETLIDIMNKMKYTDTTFPDWLNDHNLVVSHRSNLVRKFPEHYQHQWPDVPNNLPYIWPTNKENGNG